MKDKAFAESGWRDYIEEEMVCDIAGDMLMSPERARQLLLGSGNITTMRRVKDTIQNWIRDALDRLPSKSVKDPANIKKLRKAWEDTYDALERAYAETVKAVEAEAQKGDKRMSLGGMAREAAYAEWVKGKKGGRRYSLGDTRESFRERQKRAVKERGVVEPGLNEASVRVVDVPRHPYTGSIADATYQAIKAAKEKYVPNGNPRTLLYSNYGKQFEYKISGQAITICLSSEHQKESSDKGGHLALATQLDRVIGESIEVEEHPDRIKTEKGRDNSRINPDALMHRFYGVAKIGKTVYRVMTLLREDWRQGEGNGIHSYEAIEIEVLDEQTPNTSNGVDTPNSELEAYPVANLIKDVGKTMEPDKLLLDYSAKTTENGSEALNGGEGVRGDASQNETTSADGRRLSLNGDREERKALRESEESKRLFEATKKKFGTTKDINEAGYILPDGTMLDFSGRHWMDEGQDTSHLAGSRAVDHREISDVGYDKDENETGFKTDMSDFINRGAIRVHRSGNYSRINLSMEPTAEQMKVLRRFAAGVDNVDVDFGDGNRTDHFAEYEDAWPSRVLGDIDRYFTEGIIPSGSRRYSLTKAPTFYSNAERAVENVKQEKAKAEQWKAMLTKAGGIKAGEDKWMGLSQWLDERRGQSLTKDDVLGFVRDNGIRMEERSYQEGVVDPSVPEDVYNDFEDYYNRWTDDDFDTPLDHLEYAWDVYCNVSPRWIRESIEPHLYHDGTWDLRVSDRDILRKQVGINSDYSINRTRLDYTTRGLENKREIAFVVPGVEPYQEGDTIHFGPENQGKAVMWVRFGETTDTDGKRVLVIDEIQSNRHQDAREQGYMLAPRWRAAYEQLRKRHNDLMHAYYERAAEWANAGGSFEDAYKEDARAKALREQWDAAGREMEAFKVEHGGSGSSTVPAAPFEKNWHEVAMKRMLRLAAEEGFDKVAWTTGEQQAERYDMSKQVDQVIYKKNEDGTYRVSAIEGGRGNLLGESIQESELAEYVGRSLAQKITDSKGDEISVSGRNWETEKWNSLSGEDLRIGGEGMKGFYDQMLPRFMDKYGKKWGVKTGEVTLDTPGKEVMHSVDVTPEMKESVMQGQPLFSLSGGERVRVRIDNGRFNEELDNLERGELPNGHIFNLGRPASILRSAGFPDAPIELSATKLTEKARQHGFAIGDVRNLAAALQDPVAVFAYGDKGKAQNVIVEIVRDGKNFVVGVHFNQTRRGVEVSDIRGLFPKDNAEWLNWINQGKLLYVDKEKIQTLIDQQRTNPAEVAYLDLDSVANLVNNFENPSIQSVKTTENGRKYSLSGGARRWWGEREEALRSEYDALAQQARPLRRARQEGTAYSPNELAAIDRQMRALRGKIDLVNKVNDLLDNAAARPKRVAPPICYLSTVICYL